MCKRDARMIAASVTEKLPYIIPITLKGMPEARNISTHSAMNRASHDARDCPVIVRLFSLQAANSGGLHYSIRIAPPVDLEPEFDPLEELGVVSGVDGAPIVGPGSAG